MAATQGTAQERRGRGRSTKATAKRAPAKRAPAKRAPAKRAPAKRAPAKRGSAKRGSAKRPAAKAASATRVSATKTSATTRRAAQRGHTVAAAVLDADSGMTVRLPAVGRVHLPPGPHLAYYAGLGLLGAIEVIEWPIAILLGVGKALADNRSHQTLQEFGDSLESA